MTTVGRLGFATPAPVLTEDAATAVFSALSRPAFSAMVRFFLIALVALVSVGDVVVGCLADVGETLEAAEAAPELGVAVCGPVVGEVEGVPKGLNRAFNGSFKEFDLISALCLRASLYKYAQVIWISELAGRRFHEDVRVMEASLDFQNLPLVGYDLVALLLWNLFLKLRTRKTQRQLVGVKWINMVPKNCKSLAEIIPVCEPSPLFHDEQYLWLCWI